MFRLGDAIGVVVWRLWNKKVNSRKTHFKVGIVININLWKIEVSIVQFPGPKIPDMKLVIFSTTFI
jgi:hypothetical protein